MCKPETPAVKAFLHVARRVLPGMCALMTALAAAPGTAASQETSAVVGRVLDQGDLEPVSGALVALTEFTHHRTRTDA